MLKVIATSEIWKGEKDEEMLKHRVGRGAALYVEAAIVLKSMALQEAIEGFFFPKPRQRQNLFMVSWEMGANFDHD